MKRLSHILVIMLLAGGVAACGGDDDDNNSDNNDNNVADTGVEEDTGDMDAGEEDTGDMDAGGEDTGDMDAGEEDTGDMDAGEEDTGDMDAGEEDTGDMDAGEEDTGDMDAGDMDASDPDTGDMDTGDPDTGMTDTGMADTGPVDNSVNPGDLVITEAMQNPSAVNDSEGEYFEVFNTTSRTLHLNGLVVSDLGSDSFTVTDPNTDPIELAPMAYFVFAKNGDTATNGGLNVDYDWSTGGNMSLSNGDDEIVIADANGVEIDRVEWDGGPTWPDPEGTSMQFGAEFDATGDDNNDGANWCTSRDAYGDGDLGTPGAANVDCALPSTLVSIYELQDPASTNRPGVQTPVRVEGVVVTAVGADEIWVQNARGGEYSGLYVETSGVSTVVSVGDNVDLEGTYTEDFDVTTVVANSLTVTSGTDSVTAQRVDASVLADPATAEKWEGVLLTLAQPAVTNEEPDSNDFGEFRVDGALRVDDGLFDFDTNVADPTNCDAFDEISGVLHFTFGNYKLLPRDAADFGSLTSLSSSGAAVTVNVETTGLAPADACVDNGGMVTWSNNTSTAETATERDPVADAPLASPSFNLSLPAFSSAMSPALTTGQTVHYTSTVTATLLGRIIVLE